MAGKMLRRWIPVLFLLLAAIAFYVWARSRRPAVEYAVAYVAQPSAIVWNANAQVRQPITTLHYGDRIAILQKSGERTEVRNDAGVRGWIEVATLMDADLWQQSAQLLARAKTLPVQARGHTRTISNVRMAAGRDSQRIFQLGRNEPVTVLEGRTSPVPAEGSQAPTAGSGQSLPKMEDWLLILREPPAAPAANAPGVEPVTGPAGAGGTATAGTVTTGASAMGTAAPRAANETDGSAVSPGATNLPQTPAVPIAGWVLARFIDLDPPAPIPDYFSAAGIHVVAWAVLNMAPDDSGPKPQYLVAGARGGEGQACNFTILRVYTWGAVRQRYETAYVENDICGRMPIRVASTADSTEFRFADPMQNGADRVYRMRQTSVRRVIETAARTAPAQVRPKTQTRAKPRAKSTAKPSARKSSAKPSMKPSAKPSAKL